ncbi:PREDICTED: MICOS complex subunit Mic60 isoform X1 [Drosophila arizonae]|uniref:MICOS complex subunit MIC60 n=1 Tax=Drosophila arizonae TaxID=7263 RepID=A0ABM1Q1E8_DROAR|nr:PREDICTED: MICOS complex subunit Mic60 isoform X1 [Drosophila arizonae]
MEKAGSNRLPFFCKRAYNVDGQRASQYLSLERNWAGKLFSPPVRVCGTHHRSKLTKFCGYIMYRLAAIECKSAMQRTLPQTSSRQYSSNNNRSHSGNGQQQNQQQQEQHQHQRQRQRGSLPPPPNAREAGFGKVMVLLSPLAAVGGVITYSKYDNDFRKMVEKNVPGAEAVIKVALQEEPPFQGITKSVNDQIDSIKSTFTSVSDTVSSASNKVTGFFGGKKDPPVQAASKPNETAVQKTDKLKSAAAPAQPAAQKETKIATKSDVTPPPPKPAAPQPQPLPHEVVELEKAIELSAQLAIKEYNSAIGVLNFNDDVRRVVDKAVEHGENSLWATLKNRASARDSAVQVAERAAREAQEKIERCQIALSKAANAKNQEKVEQVRDKIQKLVAHINKVKDELYRQKDTASVSDKYWRSVEQARNYFIDEIESIFPGINLAEKKLNLSKEDLDLFILHAYSHVVAYQKELQRLQTDGELRLKRAIDSLRGDNSSEALRAQLDYHLEAEKRKLAVENQKKIFQIHAEADKQLRLQLKKQTEAHTDHIKDIVAQRESDLTRAFQREMDDKLAAEKANYKLQLAAMLGKLRGMDAALAEIEDKFAERAETERSANQAQALWAACQALWASVRTATPGVHYKDKLRPLKNEINAIAKVAEGDELVIAVLENMPKEAQERGVFPEDALRERFLNVERIARRLAMVPENGGSIPIYFLSFLQSLFILRPDNPVSSDELENKPFDYSKLDTYDILNRARYHVDRGDFLQALKYLNLLQGAPREVANDWMKETRLMLETQQAANTLMAHAAASGLMYL